MAMSYGEGVMLGQMMGDSHRANLQAASTASDNARLRQENLALIKENARLKQEIENQKKEHSRLYEKTVDNASTASAGMILAVGLVKALDSIPANIADQIRQQIVAHSEGRFKVLDGSIHEARKKGVGRFPTIEESMKDERKFDYKKLGFK